MSEQAHQTNEEYLAHHPDAITDPRKAEVMAHASDYFETALVEHSNEAINWAAEGFVTYYELENRTKAHLDSAQIGRTKADSMAKIAGDAYDIKRGKNPADTVISLAQQDTSEISDKTPDAEPIEQLES